MNITQNWNTCSLSELSDFITPIEAVAAKHPKIALVVSHRRNSQGAIGTSGISEFNYNIKLCKELMRAHTNAVGLGKEEYVDLRMFYRDDIAGCKDGVKRMHTGIEAWGADYILNLEFTGSTNRDNEGHSVLYCFKQDEPMAKMLDRQFKKNLKQAHLGISKPTTLREFYTLTASSVPTIISRPFFASSQKHYAVEGLDRPRLVESYLNLFQGLHRLHQA